MQTERLLLRKLKISDAQSLYEYWSNEEVTKHMNIAPFENIKQAEEMIILLHSLAEQQKAFRWSIVCKRSNQVLGTCGFNTWDKENRRAEIGYELGKQHWRQGFMQEALIGLISYGFRELNFNRVQALVEPSNIASRQLLMKIGFQEEGVLRQYEQVKGVFIDLSMYSILRQDKLQPNRSCLC